SEASGCRAGGTWGWARLTGRRGWRRRGTRRARDLSTPRSASHASEHRAPIGEGQRQEDPAAVREDRSQAGRVAGGERSLGQLLSAEDRRQREREERRRAAESGAGRVARTASRRRERAGKGAHRLDDVRERRVAEVRFGGAPQVVVQEAVGERGDRAGGDGAFGAATEQEP